MVSIVLYGPKAWIPLFGLVDSGADYTFIPIQLADYLGVDLGQCRREECSTAGGQTTQHVWEPGLDAQVQGINETLHLQTSFSATPVMLLGREDFFNAFKVNFDQRSQRFTLTSFE